MINPTAYDIALNKATIGIWTYSFSSNILSCTHAMCVLHGVKDAAALDTLQKWEALIHPEDVTSFHKALASKKNIAIDCRICWADGSVHYLHYQAEVSKDKTEFTGISFDSTAQKTAEILLKSTKNELNSLLNSSTHVCIIATDLKGSITHFNKGAELLLGYTAAEVVGIQTPGIFHVPSEIERRIIELKTKHGVEITGFELYEKHLEYGDYEDLYWTYVRKDGSTVPVQLAVSSIKDDQNEITGMLGIATEVSEQKRFEKSLKESEQRWHLTFEHAAVGMAIVSLEGHWIKVNKSLCAILGYTEQELLQLTFQEITHPEDLESDIILVKKLLDNELKSYNLEKRYFHKNGSIIWIMLSASLVRDDTGKPLHFVSQIQDITKRKLVEEENAHLGSLIKDMNDAVFSTDLSFTIKSWNNAAAELFGFSAQEAIGSPSADITKPDISQEKRQEIFKALLENGIWKGPIEYFRKDGSTFMGLISMSMTKNMQGETSGYVGFVRDITELKAIEAKTNQLAAIVLSSEDAIVSESLAGKILTWNKGAENIFGYTEEEVIGKHISFLIPNEVVFNEHEIIAKIKAGQSIENFETIRLRKDGSTIALAISFSPIRDQSGLVIGVSKIARDVTEETRLRDKYQQLNLELNAILDSGNYVSVISTDLNGLITTFNRGAENLLGYTAEEMIGKNSPVIFHSLAEIEEHARHLSEHFGEPISGFDAFVAYAKRGSHESREWTYIRKDGTEFPVQLVVTAIQNSEGQITGFLGIATDISETKQLQLQQYETIQIVNEQNKRLINFAHIVSHNLRSHAGNFSLLLDLYKYEKEDIEKEELIRLLNLASSKLSETIDSLNEIIFIQTNINEQRKEINLKEAIQESVKSVGAEIQQNEADIQIDVPEDLNIRYVSSYLESILLNFLTNALKYRHPNRKPKLSFKAIPEGKHIILYISDNGLGIDLDKYRDKLFGMYKTFHEHKDAKGIGLFITKNQVESMGGKIEVESKVNEGTTFKVYL